MSALAVKLCDGVSRVRHPGAGGRPDVQCADTRGEGAWCWQPSVLGVLVETGWTEQWGQMGAAMVLPQEGQLSLLLQE
jgi:hypothetical protein